MSTAEIMTRMSRKQPIRYASETHATALRNYLLLKAGMHDILPAFLGHAAHAREALGTHDPDMLDTLRQSILTGDHAGLAMGLDRLQDSGSPPVLGVRDRPGQRPYHRYPGGPGLQLSLRDILGPILRAEADSSHPLHQRYGTAALASPRITNAVHGELNRPIQAVLGNPHLGELLSRLHPLLPSSEHADRIPGILEGLHATGHPLYLVGLLHALRQAPTTSPRPALIPFVGSGLSAALRSLRQPVENPGAGQ